jgi:hypothetical protein
MYDTQIYIQIGSSLKISMRFAISADRPPTLPLCPNAFEAEGIVNAFVVTEDGRRKSTHRVRVGPLPYATEVERLSDQLRELGARRSRSVVMP